MLRVTNYLRRLQLPLFFALSLIIAWAIWIPQASARLGLSDSAIPIDSPLMIVAVWGPGLAAILLTLATTGRGGVCDLFRPLGRWRVGAHWYAFALLFPAAIWLLGRALDTLLGQSYELVSPLAALGPSAVMLPVLIIFAFPNTLGEELGWRGFALPRLQTRFSALGASIILGLFWGFWHIPTLIAQGQSMTGLSLLAAVVGTVPIAIIYTWIYNNTQNSLLVVWLFHTADAITQYVLPRLPSITDDLLVWIAAVLVVVLAGPRCLTEYRLSRMRLAHHRG